MVDPGGLDETIGVGAGSRTIDRHTTGLLSSHTNLSTLGRTIDGMAVVEVPLFALIQEYYTERPAFAAMGAKAVRQVTDLPVPVAVLPQSVQPAWQRVGPSAERRFVPVAAFEEGRGDLHG